MRVNDVAELVQRNKITGLSGNISLGAKTGKLLYLIKSRNLRNLLLYEADAHTLLVKNAP